jgi:hypothetical protein
MQYARIIKRLKFRSFVPVVSRRELSHMRIKGIIAIAVACVCTASASYVEPTAGAITRLKFDDEASRAAALGSFDAYRYIGFKKTYEGQDGSVMEAVGLSGIVLTRPIETDDGADEVLWVRPDPQRSRLFDAGPERMEYTCRWSPDQRVLWLAVLIVSDGAAELAVERLALEKSDCGIYTGKELFYFGEKIVHESIRSDAFQRLVIEQSDTDPTRVSVKIDLKGMLQQVVELSKSGYPVNFEEEFERRLKSAPEIDELQSKIDALHSN